MNVKELYPIGTILMLKGAEKRLMVIGVKQTSVEEGDDTEYDYIGVLYPEGYLGGEYQFLFNHEDVDKVYYRGYEDDERFQFIEQLSKLYSK